MLFRSDSSGGSLNGLTPTMRRYEDADELRASLNVVLSAELDADDNLREPLAYSWRG